MLKFDICFKDTSPDSGKVTKEVVLATSDEIKAAMWIRGSLEYQWFSDKGENDGKREFFVQEREVDEVEEE